MASSLPNVKSRLHQASNGDEKALKHLGIYCGFTYECPTRFNPSKKTEQELQQQLTDTIFFAESANRLHLDSAEQVARTAMEHIIHTYFGHFGHLPDMNMDLSGRDLAKQLFEDVSELTRATHILHRFDQEDAEVPAEDSNETDGEQSGEEYHPEGSSSESCSSSEDEPPPPRKRSLSPTVETSPKKAKTSSLENSPASTVRSHHRQYSCPVPNCSFYGNDLRRHLQIHVRKREVDKNEVEKMLTIVRAGAKQRGNVQKRRGQKP